MKIDSRIYIFIFALSVVVSAQASEEDDWSCEIVNGTRCSGNMISGFVGGPKRVSLKASFTATCTDAKKGQTNTFLASSTRVFNGKITGKTECISASTPCIQDFKVCVQDPDIPAVTLSCSFVKDFEGTGSEGQNAKCGTNGAKQKTYLLDTGKDVTKIEYSSERILVKKPVS